MLRTASVSAVGRSASNQDASRVSSFAHDVRLLAVADGMGSSVSGKIASDLALQAIHEYMEGHLEHRDEAWLSHELRDLFVDSFYQAHKAIYQAIENNPAYSGMATTVCAGLIHQNTLLVGNIGSSCCFLLSGKTLRKITVDHTHLQELRNHNMLHPTSAQVQKYAYMVTRFINENMFSPDMFPANEAYITLQNQDVMLFCTDGLIIDKADDAPAYIKQILSRNRSDMQAAAEKLIEYALKHGSEDNITVTLARYDEKSGQRIFPMIW